MRAKDYLLDLLCVKPLDGGDPAALATGSKENDRRPVTARRRIETAVEMQLLALGMAYPTLMANVLSLPFRLSDGKDTLLDTALRGLDVVGAFATALLVLVSIVPLATREAGWLLRCAGVAIACVTGCFVFAIELYWVRLVW